MLRLNECFVLKNKRRIYEGLVSYGTEGQVLPALATSWTIDDMEQGQKYTFTLAEGVIFHDGSDWDCSVAKLNFDHVLAGDLRTPGMSCRCRIVWQFLF